MLVLQNAQEYKGFEKLKPGKYKAIVKSIDVKDIVIKVGITIGETDYKVDVWRKEYRPEVSSDTSPVGLNSSFICLLSNVFQTETGAQVSNNDIQNYVMALTEEQLKDVLGHLLNVEVDVKCYLSKYKRVWNVDPTVLNEKSYERTYKKQGVEIVETGYWSNEETEDDDEKTRGFSFIRASV